jgi:phospholipid/cholesterol/gamma-HCH transport system substrate-binding protein
METKVNQAVVGAFVLVLAAAGIAAVLWLGSGRLSRQEYGTYLAYFTDSVSGLNLHAPVKCRGVAVGSVREIALDPGEPERVRVVMEVARGTPVREDSVAILGVQGLTGIAYVELEGGSRGSPELRARPGEPHPVVRTGPSMMRRLDTAGTRLLADLDESTRRLNEVLDPDTRASLRATFADLSRVARALARRSADVETTVAGAAALARNAARASAELPGVLARIDRGAAAIEGMAGSLALAGQSAQAALDGVRVAAADADVALRGLGGEAMPELGRLVVELRTAAASLGRVSRELEQNPAALVQGRAPGPPGPGEW